MFEALHAYLPELNPIIAFLNYNQSQVADFIMNGCGSLSATLRGVPGEGPRHYLRQYGVDQLARSRHRAHRARRTSAPTPTRGRTT